MDDFLTAHWARSIVQASDGGYALVGASVDPASGGEPLDGTDGQDRAVEVLLVKTG